MTLCVFGGKINKNFSFHQIFSIITHFLILHPIISFPFFTFPSFTFYISLTLSPFPSAFPHSLFPENQQV